MIGFWSIWCVCHVGFFFKQKTAYELRISDWSSDVCSSDLPWETLLLSVGLYILIPLAAGALTRRALMARLFTGRVGRKAGAEDAVARFTAAVKPVSEIGRASCRERVCQSV